MSTEIKQVTCPTCKNKVAWIEDNKFRPFCSNKCQLIDFGDWASERHAIPVQQPFEDFNLDGVDE